MGNKFFKMCTAECNFSKDININTNIPYIGISLREQYKRKREIYNDQMDKFNKIESMIDDIYKVVTEEHIDISSSNSNLKQNEIKVEDDEQEINKLDIIISVEINNKIKFRILVDK
jgi:hypothetical protein